MEEIQKQDLKITFFCCLRGYLRLGDAEKIIFPMNTIPWRFTIPFVRINNWKSGVNFVYVPRR